MQNIEVQIFTAILSLFVTGLGALIAAYEPKLKALIDKNLSAKQATVANTVIDGISSIAGTVVADFNQRIVADAKKNGIFTQQLAESVKADAVKAVTAQASSLIALGETVIGDVKSLIPQLVEQAVAAQK
ncbi:hypothetical protein OYT88_04515 [Sporolactobacillus sp. CQH2019]|uniref:hypothetical protein n=1 Tax=Sporolactobacillus sp. CQH2019 TaxID=3023512 RepID=UPI002367CE2D|nr:hypothetical protein [Sporolactobacillus sp. CQH2019]MDD9147812.1 hypothetical protein [Sporolactobacillus sp. CQH2019]